MADMLRYVVLIATCSWSLSCAADPLNVVFSDPASQPTFIGYTATLPIRIEPTVTGGTVTDLSGQIQAVGLFNLQLVSETCPGTMSMSGGGPIVWSGIGNLTGGASIDCSVELRPTTFRVEPIEIRLSMSCTGCSGDADDQDSAFIATALASDVVATLVTAPNPPVGPATLQVVLDNQGDAAALNTPVALFGSTALFGSMTATGVGPCVNDYASTADSRTWTVDLLQPGQRLVCPFNFDIPSSGSYVLNLAAPAETSGGIPEPELGNNYDNITLNATSLVVGARFPLNPDANPGDGVCDDGFGNCSLLTAVDEANALAGRQIIALPFRAGGYLLSQLPGYLTITDPVTISGQPDPATGDYPVITRDGSQDAGVLRINTGSTVDTVLENLDLRGDSDHQLSVDGAVVLHSSGDLWIRSSRISGGWTSGTGGGIHAGEGLRLSDVEIFDNRADLGAGLAMAGVWNNGILDATLEGVSIHDNQAIAYGSGGGSGGGAWFINADTNIQRSSFVDNAAQYGGGLMVATRSDVRIDNSTLSGNSATLRGGGIYHSQGTLVVSFSTIAYNVAGPGSPTTGDGGGIWTDGPVATDIANSILAFNTARTTGGTFGTVVSGNCHGTLDSAGYNTISWITGDPDCTSVGGTVNDSNDRSPGLAALQTTDTGVGYHRLTRVNDDIDGASPLCRDASDAPNASDIVFWPRPWEGDGLGEARCDRGAVESVPAQLHIATAVSGPATWQILLDGNRAPCGDVACSYYFIPIGSQITLTADPAPGTSFDGWGGDCSGTAACVLQMSMARDVSAAFSAAGQTLSVSTIGTGSVSSQPAGISCGSDCSETFAEGTSVTLTATPAPGFVLDEWSGDCSGSDSCVVSMTAARSVTARFVPTSSDIFANGFE